VTILGISIAKCEGVFASRGKRDVCHADEEESVQMRIAVAQNGRFINSWIMLRRLRDRSILLTDQMNFRYEALCRVTSDRRGGDWRFEVREDTVKGEIYNTTVEQFGPDPESNSIPFELIRQLDVDL